MQAAISVFHFSSSQKGKAQTLVFQIFFIGHVQELYIICENIPWFLHRFRYVAIRKLISIQVSASTYDKEHDEPVQIISWRNIIKDIRVAEYFRSSKICSFD